MYLPALTDKELLSYADSTLDPLTSTELERELIKRLQDLFDAQPETPMQDALDEHNIITPQDLQDLVDERDGLREKIDSIKAALN